MSDSHIKNITPSAAAEKFDDKMRELQLKEKEQEAQMAAFAAGLSYISLVGIPIPVGALESISEADARRYRIVCFAESPGDRKVAAVDPHADGLKEFLDEFSKTTHSTISLYVCSDASFASAMKLYAQIPRVVDEPDGVSIAQEDLDRYAGSFSDIRTIKDQLRDVSMTEIITILIASSLATRSSDIHIEAEEKDVKVRFRIDGMLHDVAVLEPAAWPRIVSRVKLLAGLKINVADRPQDGRFTIFLNDDKVDVRVSTLPTSYGESIVMRLLRSSAAGLGFDQLGLSPYNYGLLKREIEKPNGMIITTGPTGSGKTTTLYAILNHLNAEDIKIITLEDPVEYKLAGINQSQIDVSKNYTFAAGLRSILRQDPDIVMVGEIRDLETADIAINAALTGHLVISTIHTNSAAGAIPRFLAMGVKPFLLAPAMNCIMGQRLVRRLCSECKKETALQPEIRERVTALLGSITPNAGIAIQQSSMKFYGPVGCEACNGLGYKGRIGIYEIMPMSPQIEEIILSENVSEYAIQDRAVANGMITMVQDGLLRALEGTTSVEEVFSVAE